MSASRTLVFRANEAAAAGREFAIHKFGQNFKEARERTAIVSYIDGLIAQYGPVVEGYPSWHPFTSSSQDSAFSDPKYAPQEFGRLDHTIYFRDAFVTAPYGGADDIVECALKKEGGSFDAEAITDVPLYHPNATPVLVTCDDVEKEDDHTISKRFALGSMLSNELPAWKDAHCGESWEDMRRHILGIPSGNRSSLFVNQQTGQALREVWEMLNRHELFGPARR